MPSGDELPPPPRDEITPLLRQLVLDDQRDREQHEALAVLASRDASRRQVAHRVLLEATELAPEQFGMLALLLHHGVGTRDAILAHLTACAALIDGDPESRWLVAATFDRLMHRLGLPQALGTQQLSGILCKVTNGRLASVDPAEGIDLPADGPNGGLAEGTVTMFGRKQTRSPIRDDVPAALLRAFGRC